MSNLGERPCTYPDCGCAMEIVNGKPSITTCPADYDRATKEQVDHPAHYGGADNPFEVIKVLEAWLTREEFIGAMKFNIIKYHARANKKNRDQDAAKAAWYDDYLQAYLKKHPSPVN